MSVGAVHEGAVFRLEGRNCSVDSSSQQADDSVVMGTGHLMSLADLGILFGVEVFLAVRPLDPKKLQRSVFVRK